MVNHRETHMKRYRYYIALFITICSVIYCGAGRYVRLAGNATTNKDEISSVGFTCRDTFGPLSSEAICEMVDEVVVQILGPNKWKILCKTGDRVVIKVNLVGPHRGKKGEKGVAIITDYRVVQAVAQGVRDAIGPQGDIIVTDTLFYNDENPSLPQKTTSFYHATGYDKDGDGILDGSSGARLVNAESYQEDRRFLTIVHTSVLGKTSIWLPDFMRRPQDASKTGEYADVIIYLPVFKSHGFTGITGALKLGYGLRSESSLPGDTGRYKHSGYGWGTGNKQLLLDYLCAQFKTRPCDFILLDALTANRKGPLNLSEMDIERGTDWIRTNALFASKDPVALDTVSSLFAGYDPESIALLANAAADGLGTNEPERIRINGASLFSNHRAAIAAQYPPKKSFSGKLKYGNTPGSWPLQDGWGGAKIKIDLEPPIIETVSFKETTTDSVQVVWKATDKSDIIRVDLFCNDTPIETTRENTSTGSFNFVQDNKKSYCMVFWDSSLNASEYILYPVNKDQS